MLVISQIFWFSSALAKGDSLKQAVEISAHGNIFQAERFKVAAENLANKDSTSSTPGGIPYRRKVIFATNAYNKDIKANLLYVKKVDVDKSEFILRYDPNHPAANADGYVKYPNIIAEIERADAQEAQRSIEANLGVIEISNSLIQKTIEAIK
ncbi:MAG: flagellar basal body rod protein FlgC [Rickettsiaceae bacterium]|nr:flagellar basal body rod protein FlgC [Rickettsiaceae bacterium]